MARPMLRAIHGAQADWRNPSLGTIKPCPSRVAEARFVDASTVGGAITSALLGSPVDRTIGPCEAHVAHAGSVVGDAKRVKDK